MSFRKSVAGILTGLIFMVGAVFGFGSPAQASYNDCAAYAGTICFHEHTNYTGQVWRQFPSQINGCRNLGNDNFDNKASTLFNQSVGYALVVYQYNNCGGNYFVASADTAYVFSSSSVNAWWNDRISSIEVIPL